MKMIHTHAVPMYYTFQRGSSLGFTTDPVSLASSAANAKRCVSKDTFGPAMEKKEQIKLNCHYL